MHPLSIIQYQDVLLAPTATYTPLLSQHARTLLLGQLMQQMIAQASWAKQTSHQKIPSRCATLPTRISTTMGLDLPQIGAQ